MTNVDIYNRLVNKYMYERDILIDSLKDVEFGSIEWAKIEGKLDAYKDVVETCLEGLRNA